MSTPVVEWVKQQSLSTTGDEATPRVALDPSGNIYIAWQTTGTTSGNTSKGSTDIALAKFNSAGTMAWIKQPAIMNTNTSDEAVRLFVDSSGNIYVGYGTNTTISGGTYSGSLDAVIAKLDTNGNLLFVKQYAALNVSGYSGVDSIVVDTTGNIYVSFGVSSAVSGGTASGSNDAVIAKMDSNGTLLWSKQQALFNTSGNDAYPTIVMDSSNNIYMCYQTLGTVSGGTTTGSWDIAILKFNSDGTLLWTRQSPSFNSTGIEQAAKIGMGPDGFIYVTYQTDGSTSGGAFQGGTGDIVLVKMSTDGAISWIRQTPAMNTTANDREPSLTFDALNNIYVAYYSTGTVSGGSASGSEDIVISKFNNSGTLQWNFQNRALNTAGVDYQPFMVVDSSYNMYVAYWTNGTTSGGVASGGWDVVLMKINNTYVAPGAPTAVTVDSVANGSATVSWTAPASNGGKAITGYTVTSSPGGFTATGASGPLTVTGLTNGTSYTFTVTASNGLSSAASAASASTLVYDAPSAPTAVTVDSVGNGSATVSWTAPSSDNGNAITSYTVTSSPDGFTATGASSPLTVSGLTNGTGYTFTVTATNGKVSAASDASDLAVPYTNPDAPQDVSVSAVGDGFAIVSWVAPASNGGKAIDSYTVTSSPGGFTATGSSTTQTVTGLTNGSTYTFTVTASNGLTSAASAPSASTTLPVAPGAPTGVTVTEASNGRAVVSWTAPASDGGAPIFSYTVTSSPGGFTATGASSPLTVARLTNGTAYTFTVTAYNGLTSAASSPSAPATPTLATINIQTYAADPAKPAESVSLDVRAFIQSLPAEEKATAKADYVASLRTKLGEAESFTVTSSNFDSFTSTLDTVESNIIPKDISVFVPTVVGSRYRVNVDNIVTDGSSYTQFEMVQNTPMDFYEAGALVATLYYTGTALYDYTGDVQGAQYTAGETLALGTKFIKLFGFGTIFGDSSVTKPTLNWIKQNPILSSFSYDDEACVATDPNGNLFVAWTSMRASGGSGRDVWLAKLNSAGTLLWQNPVIFTNGTEDHPYIFCDSNGLVYILYQTNWTIPGSGPNRGGTDSVITKLSNDGAILYTKQHYNLNPSGAKYFRSGQVDSNGNIYVTFQTTSPVGTMVGSSDTVLVKFNSTLDIVWAKQNSSFNPNAYSYSPWLSLDPAGNIYLTYTTTGIISGGTKTGHSFDIVIIKLDSNGNVLWGRQNSSFNAASTPAAFASNSHSRIKFGTDGCLIGAYLTTGRITGGIKANGGRDIVIFKMDSQGNTVWALQSPNYNPDVTCGQEDDAFDIALDLQNNIYLCYNVFGKIPGGTYKGGTDIAIAKFNGSGALLWTNQESTISTALDDYKPSISVDGNNNIFVAYSSAGTIDGFSKGVYTSDKNDIIILKMSQVGPPGAPTAATISSVNNGQAVVSFTPPASNGGKAITGYTVRSSPGGITATGSSSPITVTGLTNGTAYTFTVTATNGIGGPVSAASPAATPFTNPAAPTNVTVDVAANGRAVISWTAPSSNGGKAITGYTVTSNPGGFTASGVSSPLTVTGLDPATSYTFTVTASNGLSATSSPSSSTTPAPALTVTLNGTTTPEISEYVSKSTKTIPEIALETRTLLKSLTGNTKKNEKVNYVQAFREKIASLDNFTMPSNLFTSFVDTLDTKTTDTLSAKEILVFIPKVVSTRFTIYVDTVITDATKYNHFEMPINEAVDFREGANLVRTMYYTGTKLYDYAGDVQGAEIAIGQPITLGTKTTKLLGLGSILLGAAPSAGAAADPYVTAVNGITYKLPTTDAAIRLYQGMVDGKMLTVNATLRTEPATALTESNLRAYADLAGKMSKAESASFVRTILEERDTLCFFEKVYIEHGAKKLLVNLWEGKFDVLHKTGKFETQLVTMPKLLEQSTKHYKNYKDTTMMVKFGEANIYLSLYDTPLIRNGVYVAAPDMETGNGVFVNTLSKKDMTLASLLSTEPVARRDAVKGRVVRERIADGDGARIINSVVYK